MTVNVSRGLRFGLAAAGIAAFGLVGGVSAQQSPVEVGAVQVACMDLGYTTSTCQKAVSTALVTDVIDATNANLTAQGIDWQLGYDLAN